MSIARVIKKNAKLVFNRFHNFHKHLNTSEHLNAQPFFNEDMKQMLHDISEVLVIIDIDGRVLFETDSIKSIFGYSSEENIGTNLFDRVYPDDQPKVKVLIDQCLNDPGNMMVTDYRHLHKNGRWRDVRILMCYRAGTSKTKSIQCHIIDNTEYSKIREKAYFFEFNDPLTELLNKEAFISQLRRQLERSKVDRNPLVVISLGINNFNSIIDSYGHSFGDDVLKDVSNRLKSTVRYDDTIARFSSSLFMILLHDIKQVDNSVHIIQKLVDVISKTIYMQDAHIHLSARLGVCFYPQDGDTVDVLINNSIFAMNTADKSMGISYSLFDQCKNERIKRRINIEKEIVNAFERREFEVAYQPKIDANGSLIGAEALIRWDSPNLGNVSPSEFIPILETNGQIIRLGKLLQTEVCKQIKKWQDKEYSSVPVSINVSSVEFGEKNIADQISRILVSAGIDAHWLEVELTETAIIENEEYCIDKLSEINQLGIPISIDDFGTGYSSLSRLKDYPIDILKIDKSFVDDLPTDDRSMIIVDSIIALGVNLGFKIVAEGIEKQDQFLYLKDKGCDYFQGYYFSKPLSSQQFGNILERNICIP